MMLARRLPATIEKGLHFCKPLILLVRPAGFEPTTPWFVAKYSIQLSYERIKLNYNRTLEQYPFGGDRGIRTLDAVFDRMLP